MTEKNIKIEIFEKNIKIDYQLHLLCDTKELNATGGIQSEYFELY